MSSPTSASDPLEPVTLTFARSEFEAGAIAAALRNQGIDARSVGSVTAGFRAEAPGEVRVMVLQRDLERARLALRSIKADSVDIDWSQTSLGAIEGAEDAGQEQARPRRWIWTLILVVLLPVGLFFSLLFGDPANDIAVRSMGPIILAVGMVLGLWLVLTRDEEDVDSNSSDPSSAPPP